MKLIALMMLLVFLLAAFVAGYAIRALTHSRPAAADAAEFQRAEQALDSVLTIDPHPRPKKQP